jgi:N-acetylneuraminate epimerase
MKQISLLVIFIIMLFRLAAAADTTFVTMKIAKTPAIPPASGKMIQHGVAGAVIGISGKHLLIAGGANFEDNLPWRGGTKSYHDEAYILSLNKKGEYCWSQSIIPLPESMAYTACVSVPQGIFSAGGENRNGPVNKAYLFSYRKNKIISNPLPNLPEAITSASAALIGNMVYVIGGLNTKGAVSSCYAIDISIKKPVWKKLPDLPHALSHGVVVAQNDGKEICIYVVGGRYHEGEVSTFLHTILKYSPSQNHWENVGEIKTGTGESFGLSAGTGVAYLDEYIVLFGGDKGIIFNQTERINNTLATMPDGIEKQALLQQKDKLLSEHPGLFLDVLVYNTITGKCEVIGELLGKVQVTTTAVWWHDKVYIPSGEVKPGIRTDEVTIVELNGGK